MKMQTRIALCYVLVVLQWLGFAEGYHVVGCYKDAAERAMTGSFKKFENDNSPKKCIEYCVGLDRGFKYAGAEAGNECYCGNKFDRYGTRSRWDCMTSCSGESGSDCGGNWALTVWKIPTPNLGCFKDAEKRAMEGSRTVFSDNSPSKCIQHCTGSGYKFAGAEVGTECFCGNSFDKYGKSDKCSDRCPGDKSSPCGGPWALTVWSTSGDSGIIEVPVTTTTVAPVEQKIPDNDPEFLFIGHHGAAGVYLDEIGGTLNECRDKCREKNCKLLIVYAGGCKLYSSMSNLNNVYRSGYKAFKYEVLKKFEIRLKNMVTNAIDNREGRLEVKAGNAEWATVCDNDFTDISAFVVCRQLGHIGGAYIKGKTNGVSSNMHILIDSVKCSGMENNLGECQRTKFYKTTCTHNRDVYIVCLKQFPEMVFYQNAYAAFVQGQASVVRFFQSYGYLTEQFNMGCNKYGGFYCDFADILTQMKMTSLMAQQLLRKSGRPLITAEWRDTDITQFLDQMNRAFQRKSDIIGNKNDLNEIMQNQASLATETRQANAKYFKILQFYISELKKNQHKLQNVVSVSFAQLNKDLGENFDKINTDLSKYFTAERKDRNAYFKKLGSYFIERAKFDNEIQKNDIAYIQGALDGYNKAVGALMPKLQKNIKDTVIQAVSMITVEFAGKIKALILEIISCMNPLKWLFGGDCDVIDAMEEVAEAMKRLARASILQKSLNNLFKWVNDVNNKFAENKKNIKKMEMVYERMTASHVNMTKIAEDFITEYGGYSPKVTNQDLAGVVAALSMTADAGCELFRDSSSLLGDIASMELEVALGSCNELPSQIAQLEALFEDIYNFQFDLIDAITAIVRSNIALNNAKSIGEKNDIEAVSTSKASFTTLEFKPLKDTNFDLMTSAPVAESKQIPVSKIVVGLALDYTRLQKVATVFCNVLEYQNGGYRPKMCFDTQYTETELMRLISHVKPWPAAYVQITSIPTKPTTIGDSSFVSLGALLKGEPVQFALPNRNKEWLLKNKWINFEDEINHARYVHRLEIFLPDFYKNDLNCSYTVNVQAKTGGTSLLYNRKNLVTYTIPKEVFNFVYSNIQPSTFCPKDRIVDNPTTPGSKVCVIRHGSVSQPGFFNQQSIAPSLFSSWLFKVRINSFGNCMNPTNDMLKSVESVKLRISLTAEDDKMPPVSCPDNFILIGEECYYFDSSETTFTEAQKICAARSAVLASPETLEEMKLLKNYLAKYRVLSENNELIDCSTCVQHFGRGRYKFSYDCSKPCKSELKHRIISKSSSTLDECSKKCISADCVMYFYNSKTKECTVAKEINSKYIKTSSTSKLYRPGYNYASGISASDVFRLDGYDVQQNSTVSGPWVWQTTGKKITYSFWAKGEPNKLSERCIAMDASKGMRWIDIDCSRQTKFICQTKFY